MKVGILGFAHAHVNAYCTQWRQRGELAVEPTAGWDRDDARLDRAVEEILADLHKAHISEVPSHIIGAEVMDKLHQIDPVAYVRYVSVYRQFDNVGEFISEIQSLETRAARDHMQRRLFKE